MKLTPLETDLFLASAGMSVQARQEMMNPALPLDYRWGLFAPYLPAVRYGSYVRPAFIAAKEFYGLEDINAQTYQLLSERMQAANTPGIYDRILRQKCRIRAAMNDGWRTDYDCDLIVPVIRLDELAAVRTWEAIQQRAAASGQRVNTLDDYVGLLDPSVRKWKSEGMKALKTTSFAYGTPDRREALSCFERLKSGAEKQLPDMNPLRDYLTEEMLRIAANQDLPVVVHTGVWGDFRLMHPAHMIPIVARNPRTRFDLYHMGFPYVRDTGVIGKNFPNVWLNLCWNHVVSPKMTISALDEWLDMVPVNKLIAFGGDYRFPVEKVYGHLLMAKENLARLLAGRITDGEMSQVEAIALAKRWFLDNPKELYRL